MANSKISALTSATTVAGTEVLPIVQSSATVKVAISDLNPGLSTILATKGGTGQTSYAVGDLLYANTTTTLAKLADVATGNALISGGVSTAPSWGKIGLTTHVSGTLPVANGGTNLTSYTTGDIVYASGTTTLASLADVATGNALISGGVGVAPSYGKIGLTTHVSGTLPTANGGTNLTSFTSGGVVYASSTSALTTGSVLSFDGTNLGVGQSSPIANFRVSTQSSVDGNSGIYVENTSAGTSASATVRVKNSGSTNAYVGIGGTSRAAYANVLGSNVLALYTDSTAGIGFLVDAAGPITFGTNSAKRMNIDSSGIVTMSAYGAGAATFSAAGVISSVSDETWKIKDGVPVDPDSMLKKLEPGYWYYNDEKKEIFGVDRQLGFYAQNVNSAIGPEAAPTPEEGKPWGYYDRSVLAVTVMSLQKALATIELLNARITNLEGT